MNLWEFRLLNSHEIESLSFFDIGVVYALNIQRLQITANTIKSKLLEAKKPYLLVVDETNTELIDFFKPMDFCILKSNQDTPSSELALRVDYLIKRDYVAGQMPSQQNTDELNNAVKVKAQNKINGSNKEKQVTLDKTGNNDDKTHTLHLEGAKDIIFKRDIPTLQIISKAGDKSSIDPKITEINLTMREFQIFKLLTLNPGRFLNRDQIMLELNLTGLHRSGSRAIDVHIKNLRDKLGTTYGKYLKTLRNRGYVWEE